MKRIDFVKTLVGASLGIPLLVACGENTRPGVENNAAPATPETTPGITAVVPGPGQATSQVPSAASTTQASAYVSKAASPGASSAVALPLTTAAVPDPSIPAEVIHFSEFYADASQVGALEPSEKIKAANGRRVQLTGYMAPPLKPALDFFVLTRIKLVVCPFCSTSTDWPQDIVLVTLPKGKTIEQMDDPLTVIGELEVGDAVDPQTGFFSLLRLRSESIDVFIG